VAALLPSVVPIVEKVDVPLELTSAVVTLYSRKGKLLLLQQMPLALNAFGILED